MIGADLPSDARKLVHRTTNVREDRTGAWMRSSFREPTRGCACVLLGERVIAAAPFDVEQRSVDLTVRPDDLKSVRRNLEVFVVDDQNRVPLAGAQVTLTPVLGRPLIRNTDANGRASWQDLMPGEATLSVTLGNYRSYGQRLTLSSDRGRLPETIGLSRKTIVSGTVRWLVTDPQPATIVLLAVDSNAEVTRTVVTPDSGFTANFRFKDLKPAEYRLGVATDRTYPTVDQVRRREVEGWMIVDARFSDARFLWVDVTRTLLDPPSPR